MTYRSSLFLCILSALAIATATGFIGYYLGWQAHVIYQEKRDLGFSNRHLLDVFSKQTVIIPDGKCRSGIVNTWLNLAYEPHIIKDEDTGYGEPAFILGKSYWAKVYFDKDPDCVGINVEVIVMKDDNKEVVKCSNLVVSKTDPSVLCKFTAIERGIYTTLVRYTDISGMPVEKQTRIMASAKY